MQKVLCEKQELLFHHVVLLGPWLGSFADKAVKTRQDWGETGRRWGQERNE